MNVVGKNISRDDVYRFKTDKHWLYHPETTESCNNSLEGGTNANYCELKIGVSYTTLGPKFYICVVFSERVVYILDRFWTAFRSAATTGPHSIGIRTTCLKKENPLKINHLQNNFIILVRKQHKYRILVPLFDIAFLDIHRHFAGNLNGNLAGGTKGN